jgi:hypothetical protein
MVAPAKDVPLIIVFSIEAPERSVLVIVEFVNVAPVKTAFVKTAPANETLVTVVPDNEAPLMSTLSNVRELVIVDPCNAVPAAATVMTHETLGGALYNVDNACDATTVAVPAPMSVTTPVEEFTVRTELSAGLLNA